MESTRFGPELQGLADLVREDYGFIDADSDGIITR